jgi:hypothetical protein
MEETPSKPPKMSCNFLNAFIGNSRFSGIELLDRSARRLGIEVTPRGRSTGTRRSVCRGSFSSHGLEAVGVADSVADGVLPVRGIDGSAVGRAAFYTHG